MDAVRSRLMLVDDHPIVLSGLQELLNDQPTLQVVCTANAPKEAITLAQQHKPDMAIVDLRLGGESGLELTKDLLASDPEMKVLVLTMREEGLFAERALRAGAHGFINKSESPEAIIEAIQTILSGEIALGTSISAKLFNRFRSKNDDSPITAVSGLSDRELEVYEAIGSGMSTQEIAQQLSLSPKTVESYREKIKSKLNFRNGNELVRNATLWHFEQF